MVKSYPWYGIIGGAGAGPDAGRYTAAEWWAVWAAMQQAGGLIVPAAVNPLRTRNTWTNIGVYYGIPNQLEVTDAGGFVAEVDIGGALVDGQFFYENVVRSLTMPASQTYYVVVRKNFTAAAYTPPGYAAGDGVVPAYSSRITWVAALVQSTSRTTYWDIPLATVVTDGAEITTVTDTREWVEPVFHRYGPAVNWSTNPDIGGALASYTVPLQDTFIQFGITAQLDMETVYASPYTVTFPTPFSAYPLVFATAYIASVYGATDVAVAHVTTVSNTDFTGLVRVFMSGGYTTAPGAGTNALTEVMWMAVGPK